MREHNLVLRARLLWALRTFFHSQGFIEIEPPCIVISPGLEPQLDAMSVHAPYAHRSEGEQASRRWLHTSPEYALKRYLSGEGRHVSRVYAFTPCFRDEIPSTTHSPEFTLLEWYARDLDFEGLMNQCEELVCALALRYDEITHQMMLPPIVQRIQITSPFERLSVCEAFSRYAGINLAECQTSDLLRTAALNIGMKASTLDGTWDDIYFQIFMDLVEPQLGQDRPTFLYHFPASQAALARLCPDDPRWARRFELFAGGLELANAFDELSDPVEQRSRFEDDLRVRQERGSQCLPIDEKLIGSLSELGDCVGIALGFDRLVMLLCGAQSIDEVRLQPWSKT